MKKFSQVALFSAVAFAFASSAMAQGAGGGSKEGGPVSPDDHAASAVHHFHKKHTKSKGTTLHQEDKAAHLKGTAAANAASSMGTNDKGQPQ